ncbi:MAG TPA: hypothetical protein VGS80_25905, partial [Ktedonobacterales bacterium]|nr:hypothetical protein [Ktedonobacterales bacterium]
MHQDFAQQAAAQMPPIARPDALDRTAVDELAEDGVDAVAHATEQRAPARVRIALGRAVGRQQLHTVRLAVGSGHRRPVRGRTGERLVSDATAWPLAWARRAAG